MNLIPWRKRESMDQPLVSLRDEMNRLFDNFWHGESLPEKFGFAQGFPSVDVTETDTEVVVKAEVPGLEARDLDITVVGDVLTIKGEKKEETEEKKKEYHHKEVRYGAFSRSIQLPAGVDLDKVKAECKKGVCAVTLAKIEPEEVKKISIKGEKGEK